MHTIIGTGFGKRKITDEEWLSGDGIHSYGIVSINKNTPIDPVAHIRTKSPKAAFDQLCAVIGTDLANDKNKCAYRIKTFTRADIKARFGKSRNCVTIEHCDHSKLCFDVQFYKGIPFRLIDRNYDGKSAMRFVLGDTNQNVWIPARHLDASGKVKPNENIDYVFRAAASQLEHAGITRPIRGIKRANVLASRTQK